jgi:hypothetical protein
LFGEELERLQSDFADTGATSRQRIDVTDLERLLRYRRAAGHQQREGGSGHEFAHVIPPLIGISWI